MAQSKETVAGRPLRVRELRAQVLAQDYRVEPQVVAEALVGRLLSRAGARTPPAAAIPPGADRS